MLNPPVELRQSEIDRVSEIKGLNFQDLPLDLKRRLASYILLERADEKSIGIARLLSANNPNLTYFTVIDDVRTVPTSVPPRLPPISRRVRRLDTMRR
jgi:hypothetical protein